MKVYSYQPTAELKLNTLRANKIWFTYPKHFNDVFELEIPVMHKLVHHYKPEYIRNLMSAYIQGPSTKGKLFNPEIVSWYRDWLNKPNSNDIDSHSFHLHVSVLSEKMLNQVGICCFTPHADSELMWAYYADSHKGFCIGYEIEPNKLDPDGFDFKSVTYSSQRPIIDFWEFLFTDISAKVLYTKSASWSHEREWRLVAFKNKVQIEFASQNGFKIAPPEGIRITELILGARISAKDEESLRAIAKELHEQTGHDVEVKRIVKKDPSYQLLVSDPC